MAGPTLYTDAGVSPRTNTYAEMKMLEHQMPVVILDKFGDAKPMPRNKTQSITFRRPRVFSSVDKPLVEGVTPRATKFSYENVKGTLQQYGQVVYITDQIEDTHEDPVLNDAAEQAGENIGRTMEQLRYGVLRAGTNVFYANGTARNAVNTKFTLKSQRLVTRALKAQKGMKHTKILSGSVDINTTPIEASYIAVAHTDLEADLRSISSFVPTSQYGQRKIIHDCEIGAIEDVRYCLSPDLEPWENGGASGGTEVVSTGGTNADVYPILYFAKHAYGLVALRGQGAVKPSIIPPGQISKSDPLGQRGVVGWKTWHLTTRLNEVWMGRLEVAVSDLS